MEGICLGFVANHLILESIHWLKYRPLHPVVRPSSKTHGAQVCSGWTIENPVNAKLRPGLA